MTRSFLDSSGIALEIEIEIRQFFTSPIALNHSKYMLSDY